MCVPIEDFVSRVNRLPGVQEWRELKGVLEFENRRRFVTKKPRVNGCFQGPVLMKMASCLNVCLSRAITVLRARIGALLRALVVGKRCEVLVNCDGDIYHVIGAIGDDNSKANDTAESVCRDP